MTLEHRISFRVTSKEWVKFQGYCQDKETTPSQVLRSFVRNRISRKGGSLTIEDFIYTYVDWIEGMTFGAAFAEACLRDQEAADELLASIKNTDKEV